MKDFVRDCNFTVYFNLLILKFSELILNALKTLFILTCNIFNTMLVSTSVMLITDALSNSSCSKTKITYLMSKSLSCG